MWPTRAPAIAVTAETPRDRFSWRRWLPWALVVLAALIGLVSALNIWVERQALDTDNWTSTSSRLLEDDQIRHEVSVYLVNQVYANVDVAQTLRQRLPAQVKGLAVPIASALQDLAVRVADTLLARPRVQRAWREANRRVRAPGSSSDCPPTRAGS